MGFGASAFLDPTRALEGPLECLPGDLFYDSGYNGGNYMCETSAVQTYHRRGGVSLIVLFGIFLIIGVAAISFSFGQRSVTVGRTTSSTFATILDVFSGTLHDMLGGVAPEKPFLEVDLDAPTPLSGSSSSVSRASAPTPHSLLLPPAITPSPSSSTSFLRAASTAHAGFTEAPPSSHSKNISPLSAPPPSTSSVAPTPSCDFFSHDVPRHDVLINEIAWMGTKDSAQSEWMELKNNSSHDVSLTRWQITNADGDLKITFGEPAAVHPNTLFLLERTDDDAVPGVPADRVYTGGLANGGEWLRLFDDHCVLMDEIDAAHDWLGGDNTTKATLERDLGNLSATGSPQAGWHTSAASGGTPKRENSTPLLVVASSSSSTSFTMGGPSFLLTISLVGDGSGTVFSAPVGIFCGFDCMENYGSGATVALIASSSPNSRFSNWAEACVGSGECTVRMDKNMHVSATFLALTPVDMGGLSVGGGQGSPPPSLPAGSGAQHLVIAGVQTTGGVGHTTDDFVQIKNPTPDVVNLKGYRLVKRTKMGITDTSLKSWTTDAFVPAGGTYVWASSDYTALSPAADVTTSGSIADDNGVALRSGPENTGIIVDAVAWGAAQNIFVEGAVYPTNPAANQLLTRKLVNGTPQDTDINAEDFVIQ